VTLANNYSTYDGGGLNNDTGATATLTQTTLSGNYSGAYGGGISNAGDITLANSIVLGNGAHDGNVDILTPGGTTSFTGLNIVGLDGTYATSASVINAPSLEAVFASVGYDSLAGHAGSRAVQRADRVKPRRRRPVRRGTTRTATRSSSISSSTRRSPAAAVISRWTALRKARTPISTCCPRSSTKPASPPGRSRAPMSSGCGPAMACCGAAGTSSSSPRPDRQARRTTAVPSFVSTLATSGMHGRYKAGHAGSKAMDQVRN
jgi:hypothetical protein